MRIKFYSVTKIFEPDILALDNVNLSIEAGEFAYIMRKTGSGKYTLIRLITREAIPTRGKVIVGNFDMSKIKKADIPFFRRDIGTIAQDFKLIPKLTAYENVAFALEAMGIPYRYVKARANKVLDQVGMWRRRSFYPPQLSGGEQQRVAIARALAKAPALILADEPTGNLDSKTTEDIMNLFWSINASGITVIMATHNLSTIRDNHCRLVELQSGFIARDIRVG
jgi:cell division transport system ATP-binding protein